MHITPLHDYILVKLQTPMQVTAGGIHIPTAAQATSKCAEVIEISVRVPQEKFPFPIGSKVVYNANSGIEIELNGEKHLLLKVEDIIGVYRD